MKYISLVLLSFVLLGCAHFQDELSPSRIDYAKTYKETIDSQKCADGSNYYKYQVRLIGFSQKQHIFGFMNNDHECYDTLIYKTPGEVESKLVNKLKSKGLYLNNYKYIRNTCGDTYVVVYGSPKPSSKKDWAELKNHYDIIKLKELKNKYPSITNEVPKCTCRYCTSGLDRKYWR